MAEQDGKELFVPLVNPQGKEEQVVDYPGHVDRLLTMGFSRPLLQKGVQPAITTKTKETV
jgi:hypothetical protein